MVLCAAAVKALSPPAERLLIVVGVIVGTAAIILFIVLALAGLDFLGGTSFPKWLAVAGVLTSIAGYVILTPALFWAGLGAILVAFFISAYAA